ncbi:MAG TPA: inorganic phosphate transporter [Symbiobacteriaceae bacterium]|jgi:PiT family inorganic phosphate transporter|nr:inorganic phosphate transporter [Symbiobacteriaceae bacterium]
MNTIIVMAIIVVVLAVAFDFINGFHDTANAIATVVSTRVLSPRQAILMAASLNVLGAVTSTSVAIGIAKGIVIPEAVTLEVLIGGLVGAIVWNLLTWYFGIPSSSSHALVGGVAGAALVKGGLQALNGAGFLKIVLSFVLSPLSGVIVGLIVLALLHRLVQNWSLGTVNRRFAKLQILSAAAMAFSHGSNDAQKSMGIIASALFAAKLIPTLHVPGWVMLTAAAAMGLGTASGGWRIIKTMGHKMVKLNPLYGFVAETSAALVIETATHLALPVSTTHVISSTIMSVGLSKGTKAVNWGVIKNIGWAMLLTIPASATVGALTYLLVRGFSAL